MKSEKCNIHACHESHEIACWNDNLVSPTHATRILVEILNKVSQIYHIITVLQSLTTMVTAYVLYLMLLSIFPICFSDGDFMEECAEQEICHTPSK
ncbi:hypothetical protein CDAR_380181 [Caerostris darwini]|uniref:Uncharacterized protein n=1 Tax=Caerostris darwini TaxID=1538125 RepID=A0AAV4TKH4_9ARAC|nr:hypothetical protein CDAR_380181 [Caerostris darwini]